MDTGDGEIVWWLWWQSWYDAKSIIPI